MKHNMLIFSYFHISQVPTDSTNVEYTGAMEEDELNQLKKVFHEHGYLTENYRKSECLQKAEEFYFNWMSK